MKISEIKDLNEAFVFLDDRFSGRLVRTKQGSIFEYDRDFVAYAKENEINGIASTLPLANLSYSTQGTNLHSYFANLLPEGRRLSALRQVAKTSLDDLFTLILAGGTNCAGDIYVSVTKEPSKVKVASKSNLELKDVSFWKLFEEITFGEDYDDKSNDISIAGVYPKLSAEMISFPLSYKKSKSEYILKLEPKDYPQLVANEFFFMTLASRCGIEVPYVEVVHDKDSKPGLLVERFDRRYSSAENRIQRIHQEDICQLLDIYPSEKYRISMRDIAEVLEKVCSSPVIEITKLIRLYLYSYFICNGDLHAKNVSVLEDRQSARIFLSPAYDLLATLPYGDKEMALHLEGRKKNIKYKDIKKFSQRHGIEANTLDPLIAELKEEVSKAVDRVTEIGLEKKKTEHLINSMKGRIEKF